MARRVFANICKNPAGVSCQHEQYDVAVLGLGPVGLMCANLLGQMGVRVLAVEKGECDPARFRPRAIVADDETLRLFQAAGLCGELEPTLRYKPGLQFVTNSHLHGGECEKLNGHGSSGGRLGEWPEIRHDDLLPVGVHGWRPGATFYQPTLEGILLRGLSRFPNVSTRLRTRVQDIAQTADSVDIRMRRSTCFWRHTPGGEWILEDSQQDSQRSDVEDGQTSMPSAKLVIACDGARSVARQLLNPNPNLRSGFEALPFEQEWCVLDVMLTDEATAARLPRYTHQVCDHTRPQTFIPGSRVFDHPKRGRHMRWEFRVLPTDDKYTFAAEQNMHNLVSAWGLKQDEYEIIRYAVYQLRSCIAPSWHQGRIVLCGDACHTTAPFMGQGLNQGFKDAANLCWKAALVARGAAGPELLETYQEERYDKALGMIGRAIEVGHMISAFAEAKRVGELSTAVERYRHRGYSPDPAEKGAAATSGSSPRLVSQDPSHRSAGHWLVQPLHPLRCTDGRIGRLDDLIGGYRFSFLMRGSRVMESMSACAHEYLRSLDSAILPLDMNDDEWEETLGGIFSSSTGNECALVRPDRVVFGACAASESGRIIESLKASLANHV